MGDGNKVTIKAIGVCRLKLDSGFFGFRFGWDFIYTVLLGGIIFLFHFLDRSSFTVNLDNEMLSLLFKSKVVGTRILIDGYINWNFMLYILNLYMWIA